MSTESAAMPATSAQPDAGASPPRAAHHSALKSTLNVASSAANLVLFPYVVAGRVAYQATSMAVTAPINVTKRVANSLSGSWHTAPDSESPTVDLFGEREAATMAKMSDNEESGSSSDEVELVEGILFEDEATVEQAPSTPTPSPSSGVVSRLLFLPVRLVSSGVSTAAALPASAISFGGRTISGAVSSSQALASSAIVASGGLVLRTSKHVATGITHGAFSTANRVTGLVGSSVRSVSYVVPESVSNAIWQGLATTSNVSTHAIAYAIAVPSFRMAQALVPEIDSYLTEQQCLDTTKDGVKLLVKVLGPQNAFYVLKRTYELVNSEEVYDAFLLCQDLLRESLDADNYKKAGKSMSQSTGIQGLVPVVKEIYKLLPSLDELVDATLVVGDLLDEISKQVGDLSFDADDVDDSGRFELLSSDEEDMADAWSSETDSFSTCSVADSDVPVVTIIVDGDVGEDAPLEEYEESAFGASFGSTASSAMPQSDLFSSSMSFFSTVLDSDEAASLFDTLGDFVDLLVD